MSRGPVIIIEGPDGAGKTRLAERLLSWWRSHVASVGAPVSYVHQGPYRGDPLPETIRLLERPENRGAVIADRLHVGEQVYGPIYRGRDALGPAGRRMLERYLLARGAAVILARPPLAIARDNWARRRRAGGEMFADRYVEVYRAFARVKTFLPRRTYDYTTGNGSVALLATTLLAVLAAGWWRHTHVLLIGEAPGNHRIAGAPPFCGRGGCSEWLAERLDDAGIDEGQLAWVNAMSALGRTARAPTTGNVKAVIALGRVAERWARRKGLSLLASVPHPQHHKRFHHHDPYPLLEVLRRVT